MKHRRPYNAWIVALVLVLAGCGSTPSNNYYVLTAHEGASAEGQTPSLGIGPIRIPEYLNRTALVYRREGNRLQIAEYERWAEPLEEGIGRVLGLNLAGLLDTENVRPFPWHPDRTPDFGVSVNLLALDADEGRAVLEAEWLVYRPATSTAVSRRMARLAYTPPGGKLEPEDLAAAYSELLYRLSEEISEVIRSAGGT
jgi:uncharacterized lipoprotein YmbA